MEKVPEVNKTVRLTETEGGASSKKEKPKVKIPLITRLPEEVWLLIFNHLKDDEDLQSCCRASPYMDSALNSSKPLWQFKRAVSSIAKYLPFNLLLKCRLVCKQWREDVNNHLQSRPYHPSNDKYHKTHYKFTSPAKIRKFLRIFYNHPGNPFVDRTVHFMFLTDGIRNTDFYVEVDAFMNRFGDQIWNLEVGRYYDDQSLVYNHLHLALTKATALKHLRFKALTLDAVDMNDEDDRVAQNALAAGFLERPLPFLPTLESLQFEVHNCQFDLHSWVMIPYATQLRSLGLDMESWRDFYARGLINLRELLVDDVLSDEKLGKLREINSPIERMRLSFDQVFRYRISMALVMEVLAKFPLKDLKLSFGEKGKVLEPRKGEAAAAAMARRKIPTLKKLEITQGKTFSYNFLQSFPNLESLNVTVMAPLEEREPETEEDVQFYRMFREGGVYSSNIWEKLPKLKEIFVYDSNYPRPDIRPGIDTLQDFLKSYFRIRGTRAEYERFRIQMPCHKL